IEKSLIFPTNTASETQPPKALPV
ncbi:MAG: hypothetical protein G01um101448_507, partial [Parcubacteria group bacterium Gr01-1014_48]